MRGLMAVARTQRVSSVVRGLQGGQDAYFPLPYFSAKVSGVPEFKKALRNVVQDLRKRILRQALTEGGRYVRDVARSRTPVANPSSMAVRSGHRKPGTVRKAIVVRSSKIARRAGDVGVFVNVRPAKAGKRGRKNPNDPFYWRFIEFGTVKVRPAKFLQAGAQQLPEALRIFERRAGAEIAKHNNNT